MSTAVVVVCGVGGVGKTTTAAALGAAYAQLGKRTVVLTIDPARRLADALGVQLGAEPTRIDGLSTSQGEPTSLAALMLDRKGTWDALVRDHAPDPAAAERLLNNRYYRAVATRLTGSHEYMAVEKLHQLVSSGAWDVVVLDTPPAQHVLQFFEAPERVRALLDHGAVGGILRPGSGLVGAAARRASGMVERLAGGQVMQGIGEFFELFGQLSASLNTRAAEVGALLRSPQTRYLLVTDAAAPERSDVLGFLDELRQRGMHFAGFLVNRTAPRATARDAPDPSQLRRPDTMSAEEWSAWVDALLALHPIAVERAAAHRANAASLSRNADGAPVWLVPEVAGGVHDLAGLAALGIHLPPAPPADLSGVTIA